MTMNTEGIVGLLKLMDLAKQWPEFQGLHDAARAELVEANEAAVRDLKAQADRKAEAKAKVDAEAASAQEVDRRAE